MKLKTTVNITHSDEKSSYAGHFPEKYNKWYPLFKS